MIRQKGHEIGLHGYSHENPRAMTLEQQTAILDKCYNLIKDFQDGKPPRGIVAPWWESSQEGTELLLKYGIEYDHSFSHHDCQCYYLRTGDKWYPIDMKQKPETWMKPLEPGPSTGLVEIPASWYLDDLPPMMFIKASHNSHGWVNPRDVEDLWLDQFNYFYREEDEFVFAVSVGLSRGVNQIISMVTETSPGYSPSRCIRTSACIAYARAVSSFCSVNSSGVF